MLQQNPQQPRVNKPWHEKINTEMRKHLVQKIIQTIFPTQDHNIYRDPRLSNLVNYAIKTECEMYEQAKDQEEYFHLLAERIYKIQKEFEDKQRMSRSNSGASTNPANARANSNEPNNNNNNNTLLMQQHPSSQSDLNTFQAQLISVNNAYNPDLSAGNAGPPNKLAPLADSKKQATGNAPILGTGRPAVSTLDSFQTTGGAKLAVAYGGGTAQMVDFIKEEMVVMGDYKTATQTVPNNLGSGGATAGCLEVKAEMLDYVSIKKEAVIQRSFLK